MSPPGSNRSASPSPSEADNEVTSLLPSSSRPRTPPHSAHHTHGHARKVSVGGRSAAGSVRGYGAISTRVPPSEQAPRVSKLGQRRILTTLPLRLAFFTLVGFEFLSLVLTLILFLNTAVDLSLAVLPYRGSGFAEFWISAVGSWMGLGGLLFFSHPTSLYYYITLITTILLLPLFFLTYLNPTLFRFHQPFLLAPLVATLLVLALTLLSNYLVRRARWKESQRIRRMITDAAARERIGDENSAMAALGLQKGAWGTVVGFIFGVIGLIAGLAGLLLVILLIIDLGITAYDSSEELPSVASQIVTVWPQGNAWPIRVHMACEDPRNTSAVTSSKKDLPTIIWEPSSGVPGSLALLDEPLIPAADPNPGNWLYAMQDRGLVGKVCVWDRPGYGFSEVLDGADLGKVSDALYTALDKIGEIKAAKKTGFLLVGEGYGGLVTRVFASRHPDLVHSFLHLDAQTAQTFFSESPNGLSAPGLLFHRVATRLLPSLITPLSLARLPSLLLRRSSSLSRILASVSPKPNTAHLNENLRKARLQETFDSHSHTSASFRALLETGRDYPSQRPAIVVSSQKRMDDDEGWAEGQRGLAEDITGDEGLIEWVKVKDVGHHPCGSEGVCERAIKRLLKA